MKNAVLNESYLRERSGVFTLLLSVVKRYECIEGESVSLPYNTDELKFIYQEINKIVDDLLRGMQETMSFFACVAETKHARSGNYNAWSFFAMIGNLIEELNSFAIEVSGELRQRGAMDY